MMTIIVGVAQNGAIGKENRLLCHLPNDLRHFKERTMNKPMIMGRKTWESLPGILPGRPHWVLTRDASFHVEDERVRVFHSVEEILDAAKGQDCMVIGGAEIYRLFLPLVDELEITHIEASFDGDAWFPAIEETVWQLVDKKEGIVDEKNRYPHWFGVYRRK